MRLSTSIAQGLAVCILANCMGFHIVDPQWWAIAISLNIALIMIRAEADND